MSDKVLWEVGKEYTLRNGMKAEIFATDNACGWPIQGRYYDDNYHHWIGLCWREDGNTLVGRAGKFDLLPPAKPRIKGECWMIITKSGGTFTADHKNEASTLARKYHGAAMVRVPYDVEEGEGL